MAKRRSLASKYSKWDEDYKESQSFDSWSPPNNEYDCALVGFQDDIKQPSESDDWAAYPWFRATLSILEGDLENREFEHFMSGKKTRKGGPGPGLARLKELATLISGAPVDDLDAAVTLLTESAALGDSDDAILIRVQVSRDKVGDRTYVNVRPTELLSSDAEPAEETEEPEPASE